MSQQKTRKSGTKLQYASLTASLKENLKKDYTEFSEGYFTEKLYSSQSISNSSYNIRKKHPLIYRVLESYSEGATRKWISLKGDPNKVEYIEKRFKELKVKDKIRQALNCALKDGESIIYPIFNEEGNLLGDSDKKLDTRNIKEIKDINVISRRFYFRLPRTNFNPLSEDFNKQTFTIYNSTSVDPDRIIWLCHFYDSDTNLGISYFDLLHEASHALSFMLDGVARSSSKLAATFIFSDAFLNSVSSETGEKVLNNMKKNIENSSFLALETGSRTETSQLVATGFGDLKEFAFETFVAISGVPQNILLGRAQGISGSAVQDSLNFFARINEIQEGILRESLRRVIRYILAEKGWDENQIDFTFNSLIEESEMDKLSIQKYELDILLECLDQGLIDEKKVVESSSFLKDRGVILEEETDPSNIEDFDYGKENIENL